MVPIVFSSARCCPDRCGRSPETDRIQRFEPALGPPVRSVIREIDDLGRSVSTMRTVVGTISHFVPDGWSQELIGSGTALQLGGTRRKSRCCLPCRQFHRNHRESRPGAGNDAYLALPRRAVGGDHGAKRHGRQVIGDAVMAIWNAPADDPDHVTNACTAALACLRAMTSSTGVQARGLAGLPDAVRPAHRRSGGRQHRLGRPDELHGARRNSESGRPTGRPEQELRHPDPGQRRR